MPCSDGVPAKEAERVRKPFHNITIINNASSVGRRHAFSDLDETLEALEYGDGAEEEEDPEEDVEEESPRRPR